MVSDADKTTAILEALQSRASSLISATETKLGAKSRRIDFWTLSPHPGKGHLATSYEIKVSRQDFKRDTHVKQREARLFSDQFYYVTPPGLVTPEEIPDWAGLQEWDGQRFRYSVYAPNLSKSEPSWEFVSQLIRSSCEVRRDVQFEMNNLKGEIWRLNNQLKERAL